MTRKEQSSWQKRRSCRMIYTASMVCSAFCMTAASTISPSRKACYCGAISTVSVDFVLHQRDSSSILYFSDTFLDAVLWSEWRRKGCVWAFCCLFPTQCSGNKTLHITTTWRTCNGRSRSRDEQCACERRHLWYSVIASKRALVRPQTKFELSHPKKKSRHAFSLSLKRIWT